MPIVVNVTDITFLFPYAKIIIRYFDINVILYPVS